MALTTEEMETMASVWGEEVMAEIEANEYDCNYSEPTLEENKDKKLEVIKDIEEKRIADIKAELLKNRKIFEGSEYEVGITGVLMKTVSKKDGEDVIIIIMENIPEIVEYVLSEEGEDIITFKLGDNIKRVEASKLLNPSGWNNLFIEGKVINFKGKSEDALKIRNLLINGNKHKKKELLSFIGIENEQLKIPSKTYLKGGEVRENNHFTESKINLIEVVPERLTDIERKVLAENLPFFRNWEGIAWFASCYYNHEKIKFPILASFAGTSRGKTFGMEVLIPITGGNGNSIINAKSLTDAQVKRHCDISNLIPLVIDDYKAGEKYRFEIENMIRAIFEGKKVFQATLGRNMIEFNYRRPIAITGENPLVNLSSNNRMIELEPTQAPQKVVDTLTADDGKLLRKLGYEVLLRRLELTDEEVYQRYKKGVQLVKEKIPNGDSRTIENLAILAIGLIEINQILQIQLADWRDIVKKYDSTKNSFDHEVERMVNLAIERGDIIRPEEGIQLYPSTEWFKWDGDKLSFHSLTLLEKIKEYEKKGLDGFENLTSQSFKNYLRDTKKYEYKEVKRIGNKTFKGVFTMEIKKKEEEKLI